MAEKRLLKQIMYSNATNAMQAMQVYATKSGKNKQIGISSVQSISTTRVNNSKTTHHTINTITTIRHRHHDTHLGSALASGSNKLDPQLPDTFDPALTKTAASASQEPFHVLLVVRFPVHYLA